MSVLAPECDTETIQHLVGSAKFAALAPGKFALRGLGEHSETVVFHARSVSLNPQFSHIAQNLAREFGPQGVHVSHVMVDGEAVAPSQYELELTRNECLQG
jgi:hypothetical protein